MTLRERMEQGGSKALTLAHWGLIEKVMLMWAERARFAEPADYEPALDIAFAARALLAEPEPAPAVTGERTFQTRVREWCIACFGRTVADDSEQRAYRFLEESVELFQALGLGADEAHSLVDYVFARPTGVTTQEVGGVMVTLGALCAAVGVDMAHAGEAEIARVETPDAIARIRQKQASKPAGSALPGRAYLATQTGQEGR